jgi:Putative rhamnosyl transferase
MTSAFTHLLLTRFNTAIDFAQSAKRLETDWLRARLALFERYCLPSVAGQRGAKFRWLVFFDAASPEWFKAQISNFAPLLKPIYVDGPASDGVIARQVIESGLVTSPYLVTTRLDNDDALARDHLATVQQSFCYQDREFVTFPLGLQLFHRHLYAVYWAANPFLSLIEKVGEDNHITTVFCVAHDRVEGDNKLRKVLRSHQWLQVLHDSNCANRLRGWPLLHSESHPSFPIEWPSNTEPDSLASRLGFSVKHSVGRATNLISKTRTRRSSSILAKHSGMER